METPLTDLLELLNTPELDALHDALHEAQYALDAAIRKNGYQSPKTEPQRQAVLAAYEALDAAYEAHGI